MTDIASSILQVQERIRRALERAGRPLDSARLLAVSKTFPVADIRLAHDAGLRAFGENRPQELAEKTPLLPDDIEWHLIGHLQTNKVKYIIDKVCMIHSVDSLKLAEEIDKRAAQHGLTMDILIQVNSAMEESKFGITTEETGAMIESILENCPNIRIRGLMCIAPFEDNPDDAREYFAEVKKLYDKYGRLDNPRIDFKYLSMGMSNDFEVAIEEGSTLIRVGTSIFGVRDYSKKMGGN